MIGLALACLTFEENRGAQSPGFDWVMGRDKLFDLETLNGPLNRSPVINTRGIIASEGPQPSPAAVHFIAIANDNGDGAVATSNFDFE